MLRLCFVIGNSIRLVVELRSRIQALGLCSPSTLSVDAKLQAHSLTAPTLYAGLQRFPATWPAPLGLALLAGYLP